MKELKTFLDRFEGPWAVLRTEEGKEILFPKVVLGEEYKEGDEVKIEISKEKEEESKYEKLAKYILQEILNTNEEEH